MKLIKVEEALGELQEINEEIRYKGCLEGKGFSVGLISFRPGGDSDPKQIDHRDKDVVCHVLKGRGRLRLTSQTIDLEPGMLCHIPKGTLHDFAAGKEEDLVLLYSLITTA